MLYLDANERLAGTDLMGRRGQTRNTLNGAK